MIPATDRHRHDGASWSLSLYTWNNSLLISSSTFYYPRRTDMTDRCKNDRPSRGSVPQHLELLEIGYWNYSLTTTTNMQDGSSWLWRSIIASVVPRLVRLPQLPSAAIFFSQWCHIRTVVDSVGGHFCNYCSNPSRSPLDRFRPNKEKPTSKINAKRL